MKKKLILLLLLVLPILYIDTCDSPPDVKDFFRMANLPFPVESKFLYYEDNSDKTDIYQVWKFYIHISYYQKIIEQIKAKKMDFNEVEFVQNNNSKRIETAYKRGNKYIYDLYCPDEFDGRINIVLKNGSLLVIRYYYP